MSAEERDRSRARWEPMRLTDVGDLAEVIKGGGGKLSQVGGDPGESRKQKGGIG